MNDRKMKLWEPFSELVTMRNDVDRLFDTFFGRENESYENYWRPAIDIEENNGNLMVRAEIPGMSKEDIKVAVKDNMLTISGERKRENESKDKTYYRVERCYGQFQRMIRLPTEVDADKVKATYKDGVLHVTLPKPESMKPKQIDVEIK
ncbi:MAG: Hsp20/alpha crystallin family protein [candidate division WOR-3 bacterium]|nr:MAG: Hsp20/alpha crystallin family protein [candidate division WOR-3 bacterium]